MFAVGFGAILMAATVNTTVQLAVPDGLRGRVMSVYTTIFAGSTPIGAPIMGGIASLFGVAISLAVGGLLCLGIGGGALAWMRRNGRDRIPRQSVIGDAAPTPARSTATGSAATASGFRTPSAPAEGRRPGQPSRLPKTRAALSPPNPNDVDSTRR